VGGEEALDVGKVLAGVDESEQRGDVVEAVCALCAAYTTATERDAETAQTVESRAQSLLADFGTGDIEDLVELEESQRVVALQGMKCAQSFIRSGLLKAAEDACLVTIERIPSYLPIQAKLAEVYAVEGNSERAVEKYQYLVDLYRMRHRNREAIGVLKRALQLQPADREKRERLISWLIEEGMVDQALREMEDVARAHLENGEIGLGLKMYDKMVETAPDKAWVHLEYGKALEIAHRVLEATSHYVRSWELQASSEAEEHLSQILAQDALRSEEEGTPEQIDDVELAARICLAQASLAGGRPQAAISLLADQFEVAQTRFARGELPPAKMQSYLEILRSAYRETEDRLPLVDVLEETIKLTPGDLGLRSELAELYFELGQNRAGVRELIGIAAEYHRQGNRQAEVEVLIDCRKRMPDDLQVREQLCNALAELGQHTDACLELELMAQLQQRQGNPKGAAATLRRMLDLQCGEDHLRTVALQQQIIELDPGDFAIRAQLAEHYLRMGQASKALAMAMEAARTSLEVGDRNAAERSLRTVVTIDPWNTWALQELGEALYRNEEHVNDRSHTQSLAIFRRLHKLSPENELAARRVEEKEAGELEG